MSPSARPGNPKHRHSSQVVFNTLALPSSPQPSIQQLKQQVNQIRLKIHPDKKDHEVIRHCESYGITILVINEIAEWLLNDPFFFSERWADLGCLDEGQLHFPWNPRGKTSPDCILPIRLDGTPILAPSITALFKPETFHVIVALPPIQQRLLSETLDTLSLLRMSQNLRNITTEKDNESRLRVHASQRAEHAAKVIQDNEETIKVEKETVRVEKETNKRLRYEAAEQQVYVEKLVQGNEALRKRNRDIQSTVRRVQESLADLESSSTARAPETLSLISEDEQEEIPEIAPCTRRKRKRL